PLPLARTQADSLRAAAAGEDVARLPSGDLSVWSAVAEQVRRLQKHGIAYTMTPGVPAFAAAASALGRELTIPAVAQSLVLTRVSGRASPMPNEETLARFGATGSTLAIHLAIHALSQVGADLTPLMCGDSPVAIGAKASWPDERVLHGTLADIEARVAMEPIERTAIIFVGPTLAARDFRESALYDAAYQRRFRGRQ
ncbi:precorrin-4 C(11)-methyltransferase, partial [Rhizobium sp. SEMIA 4085]|uniref:cobalt-precorrin-4/precorrin-4 C(11)-methyltransferase n=1 Tax=Rhizobium sp. SEMIA 4085 TaxID=2137761 RepID=UPI00147851A4